MGKMALIITFGMSVIIAFFILRMNANSKEGLATTVNMFEQNHARLIANSGVEIFLERLYLDKSLLGKTINNNSFMNGTYSIQISGPDTNVLVRSTATFMSVTHTSVVNASLKKPPFPQLLGALYIPTNSITGAKFTSNATSISGNDYLMDGKLKTGGTALPGITVDNATDKTLILDKLDPKKQTVSGLGGDPSVQTTALRFDWASITQSLMSAADLVINSKTAIPNTIGTIAQPLVTVINEPDSSKEVVLNSNLTGAGILIVNGNLRINGNFEYHGLIVAYRDSKITIDLAGGAEIYGGMIATGESVEIKGVGNFDLKYSTEALINAQTNMKSLGYKILSWWE